MSKRRLLWILGSAALIAVLVIGLTQAGGDGGEDPEPPPPTLAEAQRMLAGAPAPLAAVHRQANMLLAASTTDVQRVIRGLRGHPIVINMWASWCGPCRLEFPSLQRLSARYGTRVAFLGLDSNDSDSRAREFLRDHPVSYPSYIDADIKTARALGGGLGWPTTLFYDASGTQRYVHQGQYDSDEDLQADIERYALG